MSAPIEYQRPGLAGSGTIACGLAACATAIGEVRVLARSDQSAWRAEELIEEQCERAPGGDASNAVVTTEIGELADCDLVIEAIVEEAEAKTQLLRALADACEGADLATTTSSLSITDLGGSGGVADRLFGFHVFNPVPRMDLVELCLPGDLREGVPERARSFGAALGKRVVEVPDAPGFVVNRLLFPYLFDAVRMLERTGLDPESVDASMTLGAGHPMGPLKLIDLVGVDVTVAIGRSLYEGTGEESHRPPETLERMLADGSLGCKSGIGFYSYRDE
ncbi:MAG: 3-hydroxyacyl-CoA dehydrogenase family protein [Solirubrobacterales bacterium]